MALSKQARDLAAGRFRGSSAELLHAKDELAAQKKSQAERQQFHKERVAEMVDRNMSPAARAFALGHAPAQHYRDAGMHREATAHQRQDTQEHAAARAMQRGPRGGQFYVSRNGEKVYVK